jgi:hypothetical protein
MATATQVEHTPEELLEITDRPMPELIDGQLVERLPMGRKADAIAGNFVTVQSGNGINSACPDDQLLAIHRLSGNLLVHDI